MPAAIPESLRRQVTYADHNRCAYCQTSEANCGIPLIIDHILPISRGGETVFSNLCLACRPCNEFKAVQYEGKDPLTGDVAPLFDPRSQIWMEHFRWSADGTRIEALTAIGRATVIGLRVNREAILVTRARWVWGGWHPLLIFDQPFADIIVRKRRRRAQPVNHSRGIPLPRLQPSPAAAWGCRTYCDMKFTCEYSW